MAAACEEAGHWSRSIQLGVNCTVEQLQRGEVSVAVAEALDQSGFPSDQLNIEVTEDAVVDPTASADLLALSDMGVQLSVDDVGTNWSSFEPFKRHAISTVKIDGSFVAGLESNQGINRLVVETVIHMAHSLGMSAIVEQVENVNQLRIASSFGADAAQGFFFARPIAASRRPEVRRGTGDPGVLADRAAVHAPDRRRVGPARLVPDRARAGARRPARRPILAPLGARPRVAGRRPAGAAPAVPRAPVTPDRAPVGQPVTHGGRPPHRGYDVASDPSPRSPPRQE